MKVGDCCANCVFVYLSEEHYGADKCRRFPPDFANGDVVDAYPMITKTSWCGEYSRKERDE